MNPQYEKPVILKVQNKAANPANHSLKVRTDIDGVSIDELVATHGSPLFVFSETTLRQRYRDIYNAYATRYPNVTFGWSYKTNYLPAICAILHQEGAIAEVVSEMEYDKARKLGVPGENIIFNGPHKSKDALKRALLEGAMVNIDHFDELYDLEEVADELGWPVKVGLRLNMDTGIYPQWSRFGLNLESGQALDAVKRIAKTGKVILNGLHCHIGTYILDPEAYATQVEKMIKFGYEVEDKFGFKIEYLDIGGGLPSQNKLKSMYHPPDLVVPSIEEYAEKVTSALYEHLRPGDLPQLFLESGRAIVDEAGYLITSITASKRLADGCQSYIADAGINLLYTSYWYKFNMELDRSVPGMCEPSIIYGPMCMNIDVINEGTMLPPLERGARLILSPVGAYNVTQWMQFIEYRPNVVLVGEDGSVDVIREAENLWDIEQRERIPARLRPVSFLYPDPESLAKEQSGITLDDLLATPVQ
jgi:diaminopimelate decarboxylase